MAYQYTLTIDKTTINFSLFYPGGTSSVCPGETLRIEGQLRNTRGKTTRLDVYLALGGSTITTATIKLAIPVNTTKTFTGTIPIPSVSASKRESDVEINFSVETNGNTWTVPTTGSGITCITYLTYRLNAKITQATFQRALASGVANNQGTKLICTALKGTRHASAKFADFTTRAITSSSPKLNVTLNETQFNAIFSSAGYKDATTPQLLSALTLATTASCALTIHLGDQYDDYLTTIEIPRSFAKLHVAGHSTGGLAMGMFSGATAGKPRVEIARDHPFYDYGESHFTGKSDFAGGIEGVTNYLVGTTTTGGHWFDGKAIYRYVWEGTITATGTVLLTSELTPSAIGTLIRAYGGIRRSNDTWYPISTVDPSNATSRSVGVIINASGLNLFVGTAFSGSSQVALVLEYTRA